MAILIDLKGKNRRRGPAGYREGETGVGNNKTLPADQEEKTLNNEKTGWLQRFKRGLQKPGRT